MNDTLNYKWNDIESGHINVSAVHILFIIKQIKAPDK